MELPLAFTDSHRLLSVLPPPVDMTALRHNMQRAAIHGRAFVSVNRHPKTLIRLSDFLHEELRTVALSDDPTTATCERAMFLLEATTVLNREVSASSNAVSVYGAALQHELTQLALEENGETWRAFRDGAWYAIGCEPPTMYTRGALRAARTAASLMHLDAAVFLPTVPEDVYNSIDLFAVLSVGKHLRGWTIQVMGGSKEEVVHLSSPPSSSNREAFRLWHGSSDAQVTYGIPWIPTFVYVPDAPGQQTTAA